MFTDHSQSHVIIVRGGTDPKHREASLRSGSSVLHTLRGQHHINDAHLSLDGSYHMDGRPMKLEELLSLGAVVFNTLRGQDAFQLQHHCRRHQVPHTGNAHSTFGQATGIKKRDILRKTGFKTIPYWRLEKGEESAAEDALYGAILDQLKYPVVISPLPDAFSVEALVVEDETELMEVLDACFSLQAPVTVSDTYAGNVYQAVVVESFRDEAPYVFPVHELLHNHEVANAFQPKEASREKPRATSKTTDIECLAKTVFQELKLRDIAEVTILETADNKLFVLDVDPHPELDRHSLLSESTSQVGATLTEVFTAVVKQTEKRHW